MEPFLDIDFRRTPELLCFDDTVADKSIITDAVEVRRDGHDDDAIVNQMIKLGRGECSPSDKISNDVYSRKILVFSSCIFITNVISAYYKEDYIYATAFCALIATSVIVHSTVNIYTNILDKISIIIIVLYGLYSINYKTVAGYNNNIVLFFIIATFFSTIYLYGYGYCIDDSCFHPKYGNYYHALMHIISSIGHHAIIFM